MLMENQGREAQNGEITTQYKQSPEKQKSNQQTLLKSKKVYSRPIDQTDAHQMMRSAATDYVPFANEVSEEVRKKLRVTRLKQTIPLAEVLSADDTSDWAKHQALKQI